MATPTPTTINSNSKAKIRNKLSFLRQLHIYGILLIQTIVFAILTSFILWLFIRLPEPEVVVTKFRVDGLNDTKTTTLIHYNVTVHNSDVYKGIAYEVLVMRVSYIEYPLPRCAVVNFIEDGKVIHLGGRGTKLLGNYSVDYSADEMKWDSKLLLTNLKKSKTHISLRMVMQIKSIGITRQRMRIARIFFDDYGNAIIYP